VELYLVIAVGVLAAMQIAAGYLIVQQQRVVDRFDDRIAHLTAGISLLTDTTEGALRDMAQEINRIGTTATDRPRPRAVTQRRMAAAARRGHTVQQIAADERVSEGEVMLRLQLAESTPRTRVHDSVTAR
jgi:DNA-binding NarL/FixJ family response regulator